MGLGLHVTGLRKSFKSPHGELIEVLRGISFLVTPGEVVAIAGASGAGKSTLLHLLGGLEEAGEGDVLLEKFEIGRSAAKRSAEFRNREVGFIFQFHHLLPDLTAAENVAMPLLIGRGPRSESRQQALHILQTLGLAERANHPIRHLSGGEQQRVAVARALVREPRLVLADEPTGNLDTATGDEITEILLAYARSQQAMIVIATHNKRLADRCDRTLLLAEGKLTTVAPGAG